ncbi:MAG: 1-acyl-sn-glycerol-3-phosphate acyltransferase [Isosphaeraceae bacterium]|nr:1-acyl-sn-glycerol-3-phosphate acyltransferase [Isosphaeraceae bacterium]
MSETSTFRPAKPWGWVIRAVQTFLRLELFWRNRLCVKPHELDVLRNLPPGTGIILVANHADETDFKACLELSRRCGRRFLFMMNRAAFDEGYGTAGWWLQRLGAFSVERGGDNAEAKRYAIELVRQGRDVLVIFPEGEIYYLNDLVQPFKSGAADIGMQAVIAARETRPEATVYIVPVAFKYLYRQPIGPLLERRIQRMEQHLAWRKGAAAFNQRLSRIVAELLHRHELAHHLKAGSEHVSALSQRVQDVRQAVLSQIEGKYAGPAVNAQARTTDRAWRLSAYLREQLARMGRSMADGRAQIFRDLADLKDVAQMGSWQPQYTDVDPSQERLAEMVLKLEREVYGIHRPRQLAKRELFLRIGIPIDLGRFVSAYARDAAAARHRIAEQLRDTIQGLIDEISSTISPAKQGLPKKPMASGGGAA